MSTTIAHPRTDSGPSGKTIAGFLAAAVAVLAVGYGIVTNVESVAVDEAVTAQGADQGITQRAAELAAQHAAALALTERMVAVNENWASLQSGAEYTALQEAIARGERMLEINEFGYVLDREAQLGSQIEFLTEQWKGQQAPKLDGGGPRSPIVVE